MTLPRYIYTTKVVEVHDGDTFTGDVLLGLRTNHHDVDLGFHLRIENHQLILRTPLRLLGCNAAELHTPGGDAAATNLKALLPVGMLVTVHSFKPLTPLPADKYTRWDAEVTMPDGSDLVSTLIEQQWLAPWDGTGTKPVPPWPRTV